MNYAKKKPSLLREGRMFSFYTYKLLYVAVTPKTKIVLDDRTLCDVSSL